jgi:hypothetical protein
VAENPLAALPLKPGDFRSFRSVFRHGEKLQRPASMRGLRLVWEGNQGKVLPPGLLQGGKRMARRLPKDLAWTEVVLRHEGLLCSVCGKRMHVKERRRRRV